MATPNSGNNIVTSFAGQQFKTSPVFQMGVRDVCTAIRGSAGSDMFVATDETNNKHVACGVVAKKTDKENKLTKTRGSTCDYSPVVVRYEACSLAKPLRTWFLQSGSEDEGMALLLKGGEFIATEALSASTLSRLMTLAKHRPLLINGLELCRLDLAKLVEEAQRTGQPVWPNQQAVLVKT